MNCPNCGVEIDEHTNFCPNCGQKLSDAADVADVADTADVADAVDVSDAVDVADTADVADAANVEKTDAPAESTGPTPETAPDNSTTATEVIAPAESDTPTETVTDPDATILAEHPADDAADDATDEESTTFINDPDRINVFTTDDLDSTAISHFDPSQFTVISNGPSSVERKQTKDGSDTLRKVAFGLLAAVLVVGALAIVWVIHSHQDDAARRNAVQQRIASYQEQIKSVDVNPTSDSSRVEPIREARSN